MRDLLWQSDDWKEYVEIQNDKALLKKINQKVLLKKINQFEYKKRPAGLCCACRSEFLTSDSDEPFLSPRPVPDDARFCYQLTSSSKCSCPA